jgi:hypothetical protein
VDYLTEELSKLEVEWATAEAAQLTARAQRDLLVRLGTLLHAVEDYFFHSNFTELRQWQVLRRHFSDAFNPTTRDGREEIFRRGLWGSRLAGAQPGEKAIHLQRVLYRRLRYPVFDSDDQPSSISEDATGTLYTGGFYTTDVYHTLGGALEAIERNAPLLGADENPANSKLVLVRLAFNEDARRELVRGGDRAAQALSDTHASQLKNGAYTDAIAGRRTAKRISGEAANRLDQAIALDKQRQEASALPCPGAILVTLLQRLQRERDESAQAARVNDQTVDTITFEGSFNTASAENIGTHSLMSKDSNEKEPFREEALALAKHASAGVATMLARRLTSRVPIDSGIDWREILRFFLRFPKHPSQRWEEELFIRISSQKNFCEPDVDQLADQPRFALLGPSKDAAALAQLRAGKLVDEWKKYYQSFESNPKP